MFPSGFGDFAQNISPRSSEQQEQQHPLDHNTSGKTEYMAFPKPFESSSSNGAEKQRYLMSKYSSPLIISPSFSGACGNSSFTKGIYYHMSFTFVNSSVISFIFSVVFCFLYINVSFNEHFKIKYNLGMVL